MNIPIENQNAIISQTLEYVECPIKEWISMIENKNVLSLFDNVPDEYGEIFFKHDNKHYCMYADSGVYNPNYNENYEQFQKNEYFRKGMLLFIEGIRMIYPRILQQSNLKIANNIMPEFDIKSHSFKCKYIPAAVRERSLLQSALLRINTLRTNNPLDAKLNKDFLDILEQMQKIDKKLKNDQKENEKKSAACKTYPRLYIYIRETDKNDISDDQKISYLPKFGNGFMKPGESVMDLANEISNQNI